MIRLILITLTVLFVLYYLFPIIQVCGCSMYPTYRDGEIIIGYKLFLRRSLKEGDVILYYSPTEVGRVVIKRIAHIKKEYGRTYLYCLGDNADNSEDSRYYGYVPARKVICKVFNQRRKR